MSLTNSPFLNIAIPVTVTALIGMFLYLIFFGKPIEETKFITCPNCRNRIRENKIHKRIMDIKKRFGENGF